MAYAISLIAFDAIIRWLVNLVPRMRRPRVDWMTRSDDAILEFLLNDPVHEIAAAPVTIAANVEFSRSTVHRRLRVLYEHGLVEYYNESQGVYRLTDLGRRYLSGEATHDELVLGD